MCLVRLARNCVPQLRLPFVFQMYLSYNNVSALKLMDARNNWVLASEKNKVSISVCTVVLGKAC